MLQASVEVAPEVRPAGWLRRLQASERGGEV